MIYIKEDRLGDFRKELLNNPSSINFETKSGKTALAIAISKLGYEFFNNHWTIKHGPGWAMVAELIEHNACLGSWINFRMFDEVLSYMKQIRMRRLACSASLRTLLGLKRFKRAPNIFNGANKDVMLLILKPLMQQAGQRVEWDYAERERQKRKIV